MLEGVMLGVSEFYSMKIDATSFFQRYEERLLLFCSIRIERPPICSTMIEATPFLQRYDRGYSDFDTLR